MSPSIEKIPHSQRLPTRTCMCGESASYVADGKDLCIACLLNLYPDALPPLPEDFTIIDQLDVVGAESVHPEVFPLHHRPLASIFTPYRILPGTQGCGFGWSRGEPHDLVYPHAGFTVDHCIAHVREMLSEGAPARALVLHNFGYDVY